MALENKTLKLCNCNRTMALDARALAAALRSEAPVEVHTELCRREADSFRAALASDEVVLACTQEKSLFNEIADRSESNAKLRFVNIRESAAWSREGAGAMPKIAALLALADLPEAEAVPAVSYRSGGQVLIIGPAETALPWARRLEEELKVNVLITATGPEQGAGRVSGDVELPAERNYPIWSGRPISVTGWLGAFEVAWEQDNPIDLAICTRCNACIAACPEQAIDFSYRIDPEKCRSHRQCVKACGAIGAIDFDRAERLRSEKFDLVLDLLPQPLLRLPQLPQGYLAPGGDPLDQSLAAAALARMVGEFEKPRFNAYDARTCVHGRSGKTGCTLCIDLCSSGAISHDGDAVKVEPHLCAGCGGCAAVCPSGAMTYIYPGVPELGLRIKRLLSVFREAGGEHACLLFHNGKESSELLARLARRAQAGKGNGIPSRVIPLEIWHPACLGMDVLLGALAYGASQVMVLATDREAEEYGAAQRRQFDYAQAIVNALGYEGRHFELVVAVEPALLEEAMQNLRVAKTVSLPAKFNLSRDKRSSLEFAIEHLASLAPAPRDEIALPRGAPYGSVLVDQAACTMCMACVGACPVGALRDTPDVPRLRFIERNCVQCGLCVNTCPENALSLKPRLLRTSAAKEAVTINEDEPSLCLRCGKPFGASRTISNMTRRLASHSMFATEAALRRLQMCGDCRVADMMEHGDGTSIFEFRR